MEDDRAIEIDAFSQGDGPPLRFDQSSSEPLADLIPIRDGSAQSDDSEGRIEGSEPGQDDF